MAFKYGRGAEWLKAINACRRLGYPPDDFGATRVFWHERCIETAVREHASGVGNGAFVHVIDYGGMSDATLRELRECFRYVKASIVAVSLNYGGTARRIFLARPPRWVSIGYTMLKPFLPDKSRQKIVVLPARSPQRLADYGTADPLCTMLADSLPPSLGGTRTEPREAVHDVSHFT